MRKTLSDVAGLAGVSTATVDRVLNERGGVRKVTAARVLKAAASLGYVDEYDQRTLEIGPKSRIAFILPRGTNRYINQLGRLIVAKTPEFNRAGLRPSVDYISAFNPEALAKALQTQGKTAAGIAFMGIEHPLVRDVAARIAQKHLPIVTLISDTARSSRISYCGLDNYAAGRMAGFLLGRFIPAVTGKVALIAGSLNYRAHGDREMGFLGIMREVFPDLDVIAPREGHDDDQSNYYHTRSLLTQHPDLKGIYNIGGAASGVGKALRHALRNQDIVFVGHGLTDDTHDMLIDGTMDAVINQNPEDTVARCIKIFGDVRAGRPAVGVHEPMRTEVVFRENLTSQFH